MKPFSNKTTAGNEKSIRRGQSVPANAINMAYIKSPSLTPQNNIVIIDSSRLVAEDIAQAAQGKNIYYANAIGVLEDASGNQLIKDKYPVVADTFIFNPNPNVVPGSQYTPDGVLPFLHVSRYFHVDFISLSLGSELIEFNTPKIKVVDSLGNDYVDSSGNPRYKIKIVAAQGVQNSGNQWAYRIYAYVDSPQADGLYLTYNKVELDLNSNIIDNQTNWKEILNPKPYYEWHAEESDIVDPANRGERWFSTKPISVKSTVLGANTQDIEGYRVFVPKKAVGDTRTFQLFRWRVKATFNLSTKAAYEANPVINCGVIVTDKCPTSNAAYAFANLEKSQYNLESLQFINPYPPGAGNAPPAFVSPYTTTTNPPTAAINLSVIDESSQKSTAAYWYVNVDTLDPALYSEYDILIWSPNTTQFDFTSYSAFIDHFCNQLGKTLIIDTNNLTSAIGLPVSLSAPVPTQVISPYTAPADSAQVNTAQITSNGTADSLFNSSALSLNNWAGWTTQDSSSLSYIQTLFGEHNGYSQIITSVPSDFASLVAALGPPRVTGTTTETVNVPTTTYQTYSNSYTYTTTGSVTNSASLASPGSTTIDPSSGVPAGATVTGVSYTFGADTGGYVVNGQTVNPPLNGSVNVTQAGTPLSGYTDNGTTAEVTSLGYTSSTSPLTLSYDGSQSLAGGGGISATTTYTVSNVGYYSVSVPVTANVPTQVTIPTYTQPNQALLVKKSYGSDGALIISSMGVLHTCSALYSSTNGLVDENLASTANSYPDYVEYLNSPVAAGAFKLLFNATLSACAERLLVVDRQTYASSFTYYSPWQASWVIDCSVLSPDEITENNFFYLPIDAATPTLAWQRQLTTKSIKQIIDESLTPAMQYRTQGSTRTYALEATNPLVYMTPNTLAENSIPYAYTTAYSAPFTVPADLGAYIIKEEPLVGEYEAVTYPTKVYPPKNYVAQVVASDITTLNSLATVNWTATGTGTLRVALDSTANQPALNVGTASITSSVTQYLGTSGSVTSLWNYAVDSSMSDIGMAASLSPLPQDTIGSLANNIASWQMLHPSLASCWPSYGPNSYYSASQAATNTTTDKQISFLQEVLTKLSAAKTITLQYAFPQSGIYDTSTQYAIMQMQQQLNLQVQDGSVNPETWAAIGSLIYRNGITSTTYPYYAQAASDLNISNMSDGNPTTSWTMTGRPEYSHVSDYFYFLLDKDYTFSGINLVMGGDYVITNIDMLHVTNMASMLTYDPAQSTPIWVTSNQNGNTYEAVVQVPPNINTGNMVVVGVTNLSALDIEIIDVSFATNSGTATGTVNFTSSGTATFAPGDAVISTQAVLPSQFSASVYNLQWDSIQIDNAEVTAHISASGQITLALTGNTTGQSLAFGQVLPNDLPGEYYSKNLNGSLSPIPETGWASKDEGIKLLCDAMGNPVGFPTPPATVDTRFTKLTLNPYGDGITSDPSVTIGFYDWAQQSFVFDQNGLAVMTYQEYISRNGPSNIYIGVESNFEQTNDYVPATINAPTIPFRWAYPIYGLYSSGGDIISLEPLSSNLGPYDIWPVVVKGGRFEKQIPVPSYATGALSAWAGATVTGHYAIAELARGPWSKIYGPPYVDVVAEQPVLIDDQTIQVRQAPIHAVQMPTQNPSPADPMRPVFTIYTRASQLGVWSAVKWSDIADYDLNNGIIYLNVPLASPDPNLIKVDYTSVNAGYNFKGVASAPLNLNPYLSQQYSNEAISIYILPEYMRAYDGSVIPGSVRQDTIQFTTNPDIFNPTKPSYDPAAIKLGDIYVVPAVDINQLVLVDSRHRGGGAQDSIDIKELVQLVQESSTYWDINYGAGESYQSAGFVIIRLPSELQSVFTEDQIRSIIDKNITAGVAYKIEDLYGNDWGLG